VKENVVAATCPTAGSYDSVVKCATCSAEISRTTVTVDPLGHNYEDGACTNCGAADPNAGPKEDANLKFYGNVGLSFQDYIGVQAMIMKNLGDQYDRVYVEAIQITPDGAVRSELEPIVFEYYGWYFLVFDQQVLSWSMTEEITMTLYGEKAGVTYVGQSFTGSVETLALAKLKENTEKGTNPELCTVLVDMLNYGAAVQTAYNYNATQLPNTQLAAYAHYGTTAIPELNASVNKIGKGSVASLTDNVSMQSKVELQIAFGVDVSAYTAKATVNGKAVTAIMDTETLAAYGWTVLRVAVGASQMRETYTIALYDAEGNAVTTIYEVSVEAYAKNLFKDAAKKDVAVAMMRYGDAVAVYAAIAG
jgi:hypothetical protein